FLEELKGSSIEFSTFVKLFFHIFLFGIEGGRCITYRTDMSHLYEVSYRRRPFSLRPKKFSLHIHPCRSSDRILSHSLSIDYSLRRTVKTPTSPYSSEIPQKRALQTTYIPPSQAMSQIQTRHSTRRTSSTRDSNYLYYDSCRDLYARRNDGTFVK